MINLTHSASPRLHAAPTDPGTSWSKNTAVALDAPPDDGVDPAPDASWPVEAKRSGVYGVVSPRVVALPDGGYRLYYTQILPRPGFPAGANDYDTATTRILSASSPDGMTWTPEPGVRLSSQEGGAGEFRVVSPEVVPVPEGDGRLRMYFESCEGTQATQNSIRSAVSEDGGLVWTTEPGVRLESSDVNYMAPRIVFLENGSCRLYCCERGKGIVSAVSEDGGLAFHLEAGVRVAPDGPYDEHVAFAPEILRIKSDEGRSAGYRMYYAGYSALSRADILTAVSDDGLEWRKEHTPVISPDHHVWDAAKCSEMSVFRLPGPEDQPPRYGMVYEACDGTAADKRGVWRVASAVSVERQ